jgi:hypothetical protein
MTDLDDRDETPDATAARLAASIPQDRTQEVS